LDFTVFNTKKMDEYAERAKESCHNDEERVYSLPSSGLLHELSS